jgi:hypothetical protein
LFKEKNAEYEALHFFTLPNQHPILQIVRRGACIVEDHYFYHTGWQVRVINLASTLHKLLPILERRLSNSAFASWQGALRLVGGEQQNTLLIKDGGLELIVDSNGTPKGVLTLDAGWELGRLIVGSDEPEEIFQQAQISSDGQTLALLNVLFPRQHPMMSHWDEF